METDKKRAQWLKRSSIINRLAKGQIVTVVYQAKLLKYIENYGICNYDFSSYELNIDHNDVVTITPREKWIARKPSKKS